MNQSFATDQVQKMLSRRDTVELAFRSTSEDGLVQRSKTTELGDRVLE